MLIVQSVYGDDEMKRARPPRVVDGGSYSYNYTLHKQDASGQTIQRFSSVK